LCGIHVMATTGELLEPSGSGVYRSRFNHEDEIAEPGYHAVTLENYQIRAELTSTIRVGFHRYTFSEDGESWIVIDLGADYILPMSDCFARWCNKREITGYVENDQPYLRPHHHLSECRVPQRKGFRHRDGR
ncbi:MAG: hypothetical protein P1S60_19915, partial [Anaerolineae bacterium]|nr:hypothetical protein [Anaerolineae bacterium]